MVNLRTDQAPARSEIGWAAACTLVAILVVELFAAPGFAWATEAAAGAALPQPAVGPAPTTPNASAANPVLGAPAPSRWARVPAWQKILGVGATLVGLAAVGTPAAQDNVTLKTLAELGQHPGIRKALLDTPVGQLTPVLWTPDGKLWVARIKARTAPGPLTFEARRTLVETLQAEVAEKLLTAELRNLDSEGRLRPGFSSFWGRLSGVWINKDLAKASAEDLQDYGPE